MESDGKERDGNERNGEEKEWKMMGGEGIESDGREGRNGK